MLRHEDIAEEVELVSHAQLFKSGDEGSAGVFVVQVWEALIAAEGDEMVIALSLITLQTAWYGSLCYRGRLWTPPMREEAAHNGAPGHPPALKISLQPSLALAS